MTLTELSLSNNQITDAGLAMLAEVLRGNTTLAYLKPPTNGLPAFSSLLALL